MGKLDKAKESSFTKDTKNANINDRFEEQAVLESINKPKEQAEIKKHAGGRPKKNTVFKKTEIRMEPELYANLCILAELDRRSVNAYLCMLVETEVKKAENMERIIKHLKERGE